ncbi:MAG TPA: ABC transporter substrate-binding protein [Gaiellales bacterium]|nr:ABC transporter substrate-binding protein [Gaiellales bacterium]
MAEDTRSGEAPPLVWGADIRTFLFADMRGYTRFTQEHGDDAASVLAGCFADLVNETVPEFEGELLELRGDEALCVFRSARQALRASVELQRRLRTGTDEESAFPIGVGMGLDAGEAVPTQGGYRGASLNLAARLCGQAKAGEILVSETVIGLASRVEGVTFGSRRLVRVKGFADPVRVAPLIPAQPLPPLPTMRTERQRWLLPLVAAAVVAVAVVVTIVATSHSGNSSPLVVPEDGFARLTSNGQTGTTAVLHERPFGVALTGHLAWLPLYAHDELLRVDTATGQAQAIAVGPGPDAVAVGDGAVWVSNAGNGTVSQINPGAGQGGQVVGNPIYVGNGPSSIAVGSSVWVTLTIDGAIAKINPASGTVADTFSAGTDPTKVAVGDKMVWVTNESVGTVTPIDPLHDVPLPPIAVGGGPNGIAVGDNGVWVTNSLDGTVSKINPHTRKVSATLHVGNDPQGVAIVGKTVWVALSGGYEIARINAITGDPLPSIRVDAPPQDLASDASGTVLTTANLPGAHRGGTLTIATGPIDTSIDPQSAAAWDVQPWETLAMTNDGVVGFKRVPGPDGETVVADLAQQLPAPADGGRVYSFQLRRGIRYSTGQQVGPEDIRYGLERTFTDNGKNSLGRLFFGDIVGASQCIAYPARRCNLDAGIAVNDATNSVTFHLTHPDPDFLTKLAMPLAVAVPPQVSPRDVLNHAVPATGPYMVKRYDPKTGAVLVRNPYFHFWSRDAQPAGYPERILWRVYDNPDQQVTAVESGEADWLSNEGPPVANRVHQMETRYAAQLHVSLFPSTELLWFTAGPLATDQTARRAIAYAIDRNRVVSALGGPLQAQPTCQLIPPNFPGYRPYCPYTVQTGSGHWIAPNLPLAKHLALMSRSYGKAVTVQPGSPFSRYVLDLLDHLGYKAHFSSTYIEIRPVSYIDDYPGGADFITFFGTNAPLTKADLTAAYARQADSQYQGTLAWAAADRKVTNFAPAIGLATDKTIGFTSKRVGNYIYSPAPGNDPLIDQMWIK